MIRKIKTCAAVGGLAVAGVALLNAFIKLSCYLFLYLFTL